MEAKLDRQLALDQDAEISIPSKKQRWETSKRNEQYGCQPIDSTDSASIYTQTQYRMLFHHL
ncbi:hypothetical protein BDW68DRAFT_155766 [Aspergillus falconensis]